MVQAYSASCCHQSDEIATMDRHGDTPFNDYGPSIACLWKSCALSFTLLQQKMATKRTKAAAT
jgi:hypothetical protein